MYESPWTKIKYGWTMESDFLYVIHPHSSIKLQDAMNIHTSLQRPLHCIQHVKAAGRVMSVSCTYIMWLLLLWLVNRHMLCIVLGQGQNSNGVMPHMHIRCSQYTFLLIHSWRNIMPLKRSKPLIDVQCLCLEDAIFSTATLCWEVQIAL